MSSREGHASFYPRFRKRRDGQTGEEYLEVSAKGALLTDLSLLNKGTAFTEREREELGLRGLIPPAVTNIEEQIERVLANFREKTTDLERYIHLMSLLDRNETLFYKILHDRIEQLLPIVYTPTVGQACQEFGRIYRRQRGLFITPDDVGRMDEVLANWPHDDVRIIVVTDGERILGLGDLGAGGMGISIGKVSLYVLGAGFDPATTLPVVLDVGTNNEKLLNNPLYIGQRRSRLRGPEYDRVVEAFMRGVAKRFPRAIVQFEDFAKNNAMRLLTQYREQYRCFNDDIQGTAAVTMAGVLAGLRLTGETLKEQRIFIVGAGSAGAGIAHLLSPANIWMFDSKGLVTTTREHLSDEQRPFARSETSGTLLEVAKRARPTVLIGVSGQPGTFNREVIEAMGGTRPMIFPLSNPTSSSECTPDEARAFTGGRAIVAAGSPFPHTAQCNNLYIFPGVGLGTIASGAPRVVDDFFRAAAHRLVELAPPGQLFPPLSDIRRISREIAMAVGRVAMAKGLATTQTEDQLAARVVEAQWEPRYLPYRYGDARSE